MNIVQLILFVAATANGEDAHNPTLMHTLETR